MACVLIRVLKMTKIYRFVRWSCAGNRRKPWLAAAPRWSCMVL